MMLRRPWLGIIVIFACLIIVWFVYAYFFKSTTRSSFAPRLPTDTVSAITPLVQPNLDPRLVTLGKSLFVDKRLSSDNTIACVSCHILNQFGVDAIPKSVGIHGIIGDVNAPSVFNSGVSFRQFWDGRARTLEEQVSGPLTNPKEMGIAWQEVIDKLASDQGYVRQFKQLFEDGITKDNIAKAIATFERSLVTLNAPFDRYLNGDQTALNEQEKRGYQLFQQYGCISCHQGQNIGGNMYEKMGVAFSYFQERGNVVNADYGRFNVTTLDEHRFEFKVPSLRNVAKTAPYFHDGSVSELSEAVEKMARYQLGLSLPEQDTQAIVAFLNSLTGNLPTSIMP